MKKMRAFCCIFIIIFLQTPPVFNNLTTNNSYEPNVHSIDLEMVQFVEIYQELYFTLAWFIYYISYCHKSERYCGSLLNRYYLVWVKLSQQRIMKANREKKTKGRGKGGDKHREYREVWSSHKSFNGCEVRSNNLYKKVLYHISSIFQFCHLNKLKF